MQIKRTHADDQRSRHHTSALSIRVCVCDVSLCVCLRVCVRGVAGQCITNSVAVVTRGWRCTHGRLAGHAPMSRQARRGHPPTDRWPGRHHGQPVDWQAQQQLTLCIAWLGLATRMQPQPSATRLQHWTTYRQLTIFSSCWWRWGVKWGLATTGSPFERF